jgi:lipoate-protein ligase A
MSELRWRLLLDGFRSGSENMARDHALARTLRPGEAVLRLYGWERPTVSFGRNEPARDVYDRSGGDARGMAFVRRPTGGRAVLHHREVTYAVVAPDRALGGPRAAYRTINEGLVRGLAVLGVEALVAGDGPVPGVDAGPCFRAPAPGEVTAAGRKLVGSAQVRLEGALLQHGSVILAGDQRVLADLRGEEPDAEDTPATVESVVGCAVAVDEVREALARGCRLAWGGSWTEAPYRDEEEEEAERLRRERYATDDWTWRR